MKQLRLLLVVREPYPTFRPDVSALFGKYLPRVGVLSDLVSERDLASVGSIPQWGGGAVLLCDADGGPLRRQWRKFFHAVRVLAAATCADYDAIQVRDLALTAVVALLVARVRGIPFFFWMSFPMCEAQIARARMLTMKAGSRFWFPFLQGILGRWALKSVVLRGADHVFVQSDRMRSEVVAAGVPVERVTAVPMGVDIEEILSMPSVPRECGDRDPMMIVHLGVLEASRQSELLLDVLFLVRQKYPAAQLRCVGGAENPAYQAVFEEKVAALGLVGAVSVTGWVSQAHAWSLVRQAAVGVSLIPDSPIYVVASPTKLVECLALGVPMVVTEHPDQRQVIEESRAGLCVAMSQDALANAIGRILSDKNMANEMRKCGPDYVAGHRSYTKIGGNVAGVYQKVVLGCQRA